MVYLLEVLLVMIVLAVVLPQEPNITKASISRYNSSVVSINDIVCLNDNHDGQ